VPSPVKADISQASDLHEILSRVTCLIKLEIDDAVMCALQLFIDPNAFKNLGYSGTLVVYSKDSSTPIVPYGQVTIDQNGNKVVDAAVGLQWVATSPP
jgi:hypothetical protein